MRVASRNVAALSVFVAMAMAFACGGGNSAATPAAPSPSAPQTLQLSEFSAVNVQPDGTPACDGTDFRIYPIDELSFTIANPARMNLLGAYVVKLGETDNLAQIAACAPSPCVSAIVGVDKPLANACLISGDGTSPSARVRMYTKHTFRPSEEYRLQVWTKPPGATTVVMSNTVEGAVVRLPGASNDHPAFLDIDASGRGRPRVLVWLYVPIVPSGSPNGVELDFDYYTSTGRLFARTRLTDTTNLTGIAGLSESPGTVSPGPWRAVLHLKQTIGSTRGNTQPQRCNEDVPASSQPRCSTNPISPSTGTVVWDTTRELILSN